MTVLQFESDIVTCDIAVVLGGMAVILHGSDCADW